MSNSDIIAICSVIVASLAFFTTVWQTWITQRHSRLTVRPVVSWGTTRNITSTAFELAAALSNRGLGPAIIVERYFTLDGLHYEAPPDGHAIEALVAQLLPSEWACKVAGHGLPGEGTAILPGETIPIARLVFDPVVFQKQAELTRIMERVRFVVIFKDLYDNETVFRT